MTISRKLNLIAVAAVVAISGLAASTAKAEISTTICAVAEEGPELICEQQERLRHVHLVDPEVTFLGPFDLTCEVLFLGETGEGDAILAAAPDPLAVSGELIYTNCDPECEIQDLTGTTFLLLKIGRDLAQVTPHFEIRMVCPGVSHCSYIGNGLEGHGVSAEGPSHSGLVILDNQEILHLPMGISDVCFNEMELDLLLESLTPISIKM